MKKIICLIMAVIFVTSFAVTAMAADTQDFTDVSGHWAEGYILQAVDLQLVEGYMGKYRPNDTMTRAEFVTILWRAVGKPEPTTKADFTDLDLGQQWYHKAVAWAAENEIVGGVGNNRFQPNGAVTREQIAAILHRMAGKPAGMELLLTGVYDDIFEDSDNISTWAKDAVYWSVYNAILSGVASADVDTTLMPYQPATRAQIAVTIVRYLQQ